MLKNLFFETVRQNLFLLLLLRLHFPAGVDDFLPVLQQAFDELELVEAQKLEQIVLQGVVGFGREQHLLQSRRHLRRGETRTAVVGRSGEVGGNLAAKPEKVVGVAAASPAAGIVVVVDVVPDLALEEQDRES